MLSEVWTALQDERGIETLEWVLIGALMTVVGLAAYSATVSAPISTAVVKMGAAISGAK